MVLGGFREAFREVSYGFQGLKTFEGLHGSLRKGISRGISMGLKAIK